MSLRYTSVKGLWEYLGLYRRTDERREGEPPQPDTLQRKAPALFKFYVSYPTIDWDSLVLYDDAGEVYSLEEDYTINQSDSSISLTNNGQIKFGGNNTLYGEYGYCGSQTLRFQESVRLLERMEQEVRDFTRMFFGSNENYLSVVDELHPGQGQNDRYYQLSRYPIVKLRTVLTAGYVAGGVTLTVASTAGFPSSGIITVGDKRLDYSAKTSTTFTISAQDFALSNGLQVNGNVIEVSLDPEGIIPNYIPLIQDAHYSIDYQTGQLKLLDDYYKIAIYDLLQPQRGTPDRLRATYYHAYQQDGTVMTPSKVEEATYVLCSRRLKARALSGSLVDNRATTDVAAVEYGDEDGYDMLKAYRATQGQRV